MVTSILAKFSTGVSGVFSCSFWTHTVCYWRKSRLLVQTGNLVTTGYQRVFIGFLRHFRLWVSLLAAIHGQMLWKKYIYIVERLAILTGETGCLFLAVSTLVLAGTSQCMGEQGWGMMTPHHSLISFVIGSGHSHISLDWVNMAKKK